VSQKTSAIKRSRELENQIQELQEDLDAEKTERSKVERQRRDLGEVCAMLNTDITYINADNYDNFCSIFS